MSVIGSVADTLPPAPSPEEHHIWALDLWGRVDRAKRGVLTSDRIRSLEMQDVLSSIIIPHHSGPYSATLPQLRGLVQQAMELCLRKAVCNPDKVLTFKEFKAFVRALRNRSDAKHTAHLMFALFDIRGTCSVPAEELASMYLYFKGKRPSNQELEELRGKLDTDGTGLISRAAFTRWLRDSGDPVLNQHAPPEDSAYQGLAEERRLVWKKKTNFRPAPGIFRKPVNKNQEYRPPWDNKFIGEDLAIINKGRPKELRACFSKPKSLPDLAAFYLTHHGFDSHQSRLARPVSPRQSHTMSSSDASFNVERHSPGGRMKNLRGELVPWVDQFSPPPCDCPPKRECSTMILRCPGTPPPFLIYGRDAQD
mmetsp:Transcript_44525/g.105517  ORF Transcript_44525/g.105517 Transcript_44525/m.105517 type:complete len:366 (-) Transcript_44525:59-1156(-)